MSVKVKTIADRDVLLRRVHPSQVVDDRNSGLKRPSSAAFKDQNMSVDVESFLVTDGLDWTFSLKDHAGYSLVRLTAGSARTNNQCVVHTPIPGQNPYHAEVMGKKTPGTANRLRDASSWAFLAL